MSSQPPTLTLRFFPVEIRQNIFELCLLRTDPFAADQYHRDTSYQADPLLAALRGDKTLYQEAIYVFYKINTLYYNVANYEKFEGQGELERVKRVRHLGIDLDAQKHGVADSHYHCDGLNDSPVVSEFLNFLVARDVHSWSRRKVRRTTHRNVKSQPEGIREPCQLAAPQIETLHINFGIGIGISKGLYNVYLILRDILGMCKNLKKVNVNLCLKKRQAWAPILSDSEAEMCWAYHGGYDKNSVLPPYNLMIQSNHLLGMKGSSRFQDGPSEFFTQCSWEAKEGEVFKVNEHLNPECELLTAVPGNACSCLRSD